MDENNQIAGLAPIAVFVFKRPEHTRRMLEALLANPEFSASPLFVFADGARNSDESKMVEAVRQLVASLPHPNKTIVEAATNRGLANSITAGVTTLCERYGRVIVVEDDLVVAPTFLEYMNESLERYALEPRVMQISGHMFPVDLGVSEDAVFLPLTTSWGWATWARAWKKMKSDPEQARRLLSSFCWRRRFDLNGAFPYARMLAQRLAGKNNSWAVWWYFHVFACGGLTLFPARTLVGNEGFDGSGTHCGTANSASVKPESFKVSIYPDVGQNDVAFAAYRRFLRRDRGLARRCFDTLWRIFIPARCMRAP